MAQHATASDFVRVYYQTLTQSPENMWHFYDDQASIVRADSEQQMAWSSQEAVCGQHAIDEVSRTIGTCRVKIDTFDYVAVMATPGMLIQVTGVIAYPQLNVVRNFAQSFLLINNGPMSYMIHNDVMRLLAQPDSLYGSALPQKQDKDTKTQTVEKTHTQRQAETEKNGVTETATGKIFESHVKKEDQNVQDVNEALTSAFASTEQQTANGEKQTRRRRERKPKKKPVSEEVHGAPVVDAGGAQVTSPAEKMSTSVQAAVPAVLNSMPPEPPHANGTAVKLESLKHKKEKRDDKSHRDRSERFSRLERPGTNELLKASDRPERRDRRERPFRQGREHRNPSTQQVQQQGAVLTTNETSKAASWSAILFKDDKASHAHH